MQYMFLFVDDAPGVEHDMDACMAYMCAWRRLIFFKYGEELLTRDEATTVRLKGGKRIVQDGDYADVRKEVGGFVVVEVEDLDAALD